MVRDVNLAIKDCDQILGVKKYRLTDTNTQVPQIYALYKTHKDGMRPIIANVNSPTTKMAKFLVSEFGKLVQPEGFYVKNSYELADELKELRIENDEELVSFDVTALYPSVPIPEALKLLEIWLEKQDLSDEKVVMLANMTKVCMEQTTFQFRNKFYRQKFGTWEIRYLVSSLIYLCPIWNGLSASQNTLQNSGEGM